MLKRRFLPILLLALGLWLLAGCFILPVPEHASINNVNDRDFRHLVGNAAPIHLNIPRQDVIHLLGQPAYETPDHLAAAYVFDTERSVWVVPLCFAIEPASKRHYILYLEYGTDDRVHHWEITYKDIRYDWLNGTGQSSTDDLLKHFDGQPHHVSRPAPPATSEN